MTRSSTFERIGRTEIGRKSLTDVGWSTRGIAQTLAIFQEFGNNFLSIELFMMCCNSGEIR